MLVMAKKKQADSKKDQHKGQQVPFRVEDPRLVDALDAYAESVRRSRNMAIVLLLEQSLAEAGFWPPKASGESEEG